MLTSLKASKLCELLRWGTAGHTMVLLRNCDMKAWRPYKVLMQIRQLIQTLLQETKLRICFIWTEQAFVFLREQSRLKAEFRIIFVS
jgi:hypothetical protein